MKRAKNKGIAALTLERAREIVTYLPEDGRFIWNVDRTSGSSGKRVNARAGERAGHANDRRGYRSITIDYTVCAEHRLAFFWMTGEWPKHEVDHINGNPGDNSWANLRDVPRRINAQNMRRPMKSNRGEHLGVSSRARRGSQIHEARIIVDGKYHHLGVFDTAAEAAKAYVDAKRRLHPGGTL